MSQSTNPVLARCPGSKAEIYMLPNYSHFYRSQQRYCRWQLKEAKELAFNWNLQPPATCEPCCDTNSI